MYFAFYYYLYKYKNIIKIYVCFKVYTILSVNNIKLSLMKYNIIVKLKWEVSKKLEYIVIQRLIQKYIYYLYII